MTDHLAVAAQTVAPHAGEAAWRAVRAYAAANPLIPSRMLDVIECARDAAVSAAVQPVTIRSAEVTATDERALSRRAPVQADKVNPRHGTIPWLVHLRAWLAYAAAGHGDQSAERIAERGGFSYDECQRWLGQCARAFRDPRPADLPPLEGWEPL